MDPARSYAEPYSLSTDKGELGPTHLRALKGGGDSKKKALVVVIDDDPCEQALLLRWLVNQGYEVRCFDGAELCLAELSSMLPDAICLDLHMPGMNGMEALEQLKAAYPLLPVLVLTGDDDVQNVVQAMRLGAYDYLIKPIEQRRFLHQMEKAVERGEIGVRLAQLEREAEGTGYSGIVGESRAMQKLFRELDRVSASAVTVLIQGESGTGKELVAESIHTNSAYSKGNFVAVNCAAIPGALQESEMFGHEKGAFTGADRTKIGRFEEADGGTIFLDEVAEMSLELQAKLLRVLQEQTFRRVGGRVDLKSNFRLVAATHKDLAAEVAAGRFREDLFYRLAVFDVAVPPLRERRIDIAALTRWFLRGFAREEGREPLHVSVETMHLLEGYAWPGNVRELMNALHRAQVVAQGNEFLPEHLPPRILQTLRGSPVADFASKVTPETQGERPHLEPKSESRTIIERNCGASLADLERVAIIQAIEEAQGNMSKVARILGIGRTTLYRKLKKFKIQ